MVLQYSIALPFLPVTSFNSQLPSHFYVTACNSTIAIAVRLLAWFHDSLANFQSLYTPTRENDASRIAQIVRAEGFPKLATRNQHILHAPVKMRSSSTTEKPSLSADCDWPQFLLHNVTMRRLTMFVLLYPRT